MEKRNNDSTSNTLAVAVTDVVGQNGEPMSKKVKRETDSEDVLMEVAGNLNESDESTNIYGALVVLGFNGSLPKGHSRRRRSKFVLRKRNAPNGVKKSKHYLVQTPQSGEPKLNTRQHSISYTLSPSQTIIMEYQDDDETDMFQVGRSKDSSIDLVMMDNVKNSNRRPKVLPNGKKEVIKIQTEVSRFACRILVERNGTGNPKIFAAAFDSNKTIFLGGKATKWQDDKYVDGLTTNGVLVMHPTGEFNGGDATCSVWYECSIGGDMFGLRETRSSQQRGCKKQDETNALKDGTLINLSGMTLLWRSAEGLKSTPRCEDLSKLLDEIDLEDSSQYLDGMDVIIIPRHLTEDNINQPYVYLNCGHVEVIREWKKKVSPGEKTCRKCLKFGPAVRLCMGMEPSFYVDSGPATFAFNPCGHVTTGKTVKYWANVDIPNGSDGFGAECPFCSTPLLDSPGYVELIF